MRRFLIVSTIVLLLLAATGLVIAEGGFTVSAHTVGGGGFSGGEGWTLGGSIGQAAAGRLEGGHFEADIGFWQEGQVAPEVTPTPTPTPGPPAGAGQALYLPVVIYR